MTGIVRVEQPATAADCDPVRVLAAAHARFEKSAAIVPDDWGGRIAQLIAEGRLALFVASLNGEAVGYAAMTTDVATWTAEPYAHLDCLYVEDARRGLGIGAVLVATVGEYARSRGLRELHWQTPVWNDGAIRFYERLGAERQPKERFTLALECRVAAPATRR